MEAKRILNPPLRGHEKEIEVSLQPNGNLYVNAVAFRALWEIPYSGGACYDGFWAFWTPKTREVSILPAPYDPLYKNNAITKQGRGYTARLWKLMKQHRIELKEPVRIERFVRRGDLIVFQIPEASTKEGE